MQILALVNKMKRIDAACGDGTAREGDGTAREGCFARFAQLMLCSLPCVPKFAIVKVGDSVANFYLYVSRLCY